MARLVVSAAVAVGAYFVSGGNPIVALQAFTLTYGVTGFLDPSKKVLGPKLNDLKAPSASYGAPIAYIEGAPRLAGNYIWASDKREIASTSSSGGKGGPGVDSTTFTYEIDVLVELAINRCQALRRVWSNGKLVWSNGDDADDETLAASAATNSWRDIRFYDGADDQLPDPTYEAAVGVGNAPAYRQRTTVMIEGLNLGGSGQLPVLSFEVLSEADINSAVATFTQIAQDRYYIGGIPAMSTAGFDMLVGHVSGGHLDGILVYTVAADGTSILANTIPLSAPSALVTTAGNSDVSVLVYNVDNAYSLFFCVFADGTQIPINGTSLQDPFVGGPGETALFSLKSGAAVMSGGTSWTNQIARFDGQYGGDPIVSVTVPSTPASLTIAGSSVYALSADNTTVYQYDLATLTLLGSFHSPVVGGSGAALFADSAGKLYFMVKSGAPYPTGATFINGQAWTWNGSAWTLAGTALGEVAAGTVAHNSAAFSVDATGQIMAQHWDGLPANNVKVSVQIVRTAIVLPTLDQVVRRLCLRTGLLTDDDIDVTDLSHDVAIADGLVRAMAISQVSTTRNAIETLMGAYLFEAVEGEVLRFVRRGGASALTIPYDDLAAGQDGTSEPLPIKRVNDIEIAARVSVKYANTLNDFQDGLEAADRLTTESTAEQVIELPLGFQPSEAKKLADANTLDLAVSLIQLGPMALPRKYSALEPTDVVTVTDLYGDQFRVRIVKGTIGSGVLSFELVLDDATVVNSAALTDIDYSSSTLIRLLSGTDVDLLDIPILRDADNSPGFYASFSASGSWPGAELDRSPDDVTYAKLLDTGEVAVVGTASTVLGDFTGVGFDEVNSLTVNVGENTLSSTTRAVLLTATTNAILVGAEILQFRDAALVSAGVYTLTGLLRGLRGTEWAMPGHAASERVVLLQTTGIRRVSEGSTDIGLPYYYKAITHGQSQASADTQRFTDTGVALKPFAPVDLRLANSGVQDLTLTWHRRSRLSSRPFATTDPPLGEASEAYSVDIYDGATLLRTVAATSPTITYTSAQQATDGVDSGTALRFDVYQISATVGRGYAGSLAGTGRRAPLPQISTVTLGGSFASGAPIYVVLGSTRFDYTSLVGDATLAGIATSLAAVVDADATHSAAAVGAVVSITGPVSLTEPVTAGLDAGNNAISFAITQTASPVVAGRREEWNYGWQHSGGVASFPGAVFYLRVVRVSDGMARVYSATNTSGSTNPATFMPDVHNGILTSLVTSGDKAAFDLDIAADPAGILSTFFTPLADPENWTIDSVYSNDPAVSGSSGRRGVGITAVPIARPQITTATLTGTPVSGRTYRVTLDGVDFDYTAGGGDTTMTLVAAGLAPVIDASVDYIASNVGAVITITGAAANDPFTQAATVIVSTVTATAAVSQTAA